MCVCSILWLSNLKQWQWDLMRYKKKLKAVSIKTRKSKSDRRCDKKRADSYLYQWGREWWKEMRKQKYIASEKMTLRKKILRDKYAQSGKKGILGEAAGEWRKDRGRYWQLTRQTILLYSLRQFLPSCHTRAFLTHAWGEIFNIQLLIGMCADMHRQITFKYPSSSTAEKHIEKNFSKRNAAVT